MRGELARGFKTTLLDIMVLATVYIGGFPAPRSCPTIAVTCQYFATHRSTQLHSPIFSSDSLNLFSMHFSKQVWESLLKSSTRYSISCAAIPNNCSLSIACEGFLSADISKPDK
eukprot:TRINITY_DN1442_c0_g1_i1.p1 TRINITY_DN1442_c0_g1~~TRINITY_DN1442_c0_g1_i1.p1  ORF type:complete len:114 (+),score=3.22 TRINITY_DN1442_c0_g1_i1:165-506(+)